VNGEPFRGFESHPLRHDFLKSEISNLKLSFVSATGGDARATNYKMFRRQNMRSKSIHIGFAIAIGALLVFSVLNSETLAQKRRPPVKHLSVCGNPNVTCTSAVTFEPYDLPFRMPASAVIYDTELFYAIILTSVSVPRDSCDNFIPEPERLAAQILFPDHKVFTSRCAEPGRLSYSNTSPKAFFMAVFAGTTLADANRMLAAVKATGKFPGASIRRMRAAFNGT
jgi:hypothetical protein